MRLIRNALVAGAAMLGLAGVAAAAERHVMTVALPSGGTAHIAYDGDVAPVVKVMPADRTRLRYLADPFADFDRMFAEMRARHVALMRHVAALAAQARVYRPATFDHAVAGELPPGGYSYTFVSTSTGNGTCGHVVEVTSRPNAAPQRVSRTFGGCGDGATPSPEPAAPAARSPRPAVPTI